VFCNLAPAQRRGRYPGSWGFVRVAGPFRVRAATQIDAHPNCSVIPADGGKSGKNVNRCRARLESMARAILMGSHPTPSYWGEGRVLKLIISRRAMCRAKSISNLENSQQTIAAKVTDNASSSKEAVALVVLPSGNGKVLWQERRSTRLSTPAQRYPPIPLPLPPLMTPSAI